MSFAVRRVMLRGAALSVSLITPAWAAAETIGGGTIATPAVGPDPAYAVDGSGFVLVKNWNFGTSPSSTVTDMSIMNSHFQYHDQHGLDANPGYGASMVAPNAATAISGQPIEGVDTTSPVRAFFTDTLRTYLVPLNGAARLSNSDKTGTWVHSRSTPGFHGYDYAHDNNAGKGSTSARFTPNLPVAGTYNVYARWTAGNTRSNNVPYLITYNAGTVLVYRNQQVNGDSWQLLGTYPFNAGTSGSVVISNAGTTGHVTADAVRFELVLP